jgi:transcription antitermination factor NusG
MTSGPFAGFRAVYSMARGKDRAQVLLEVLGSSQRLTVEVNTLDK